MTLADAGFIVMATFVVVATPVTAVFGALLLRSPSRPRH